VGVIRGGGGINKTDEGRKVATARVRVVVNDRSVRTIGR